jgi:mono/diheme cytochrome c family protein
MAGATGRQLLQQMCQQCHNANLDMTISRENFLVDQLDQMSRSEKDLAITRLGLPSTTRLRMPPMLYRTITEDERQLMIEELQQ